jgi:hypothetical protein
VKDERFYLGHIRDAISDIKGYASVGKKSWGVLEALNSLAA